MTSPFPAPLIDAIAAYVFLVNDKRIDANRIVISGDSAGAHLALGFVSVSNLGLLPVPWSILHKSRLTVLASGLLLLLSLVRYLRDEGESVGLSLPRAMLLFSPWADLTMSIMADQTSSGWTNEATDIVCPLLSFLATDPPNLKLFPLSPFDC
jgi:acetyl esterase/lipase